MVRLFQIKEKPEDWSDLELLTILTGFGANLPGNFILGDGRVLEDFQDHKVKAADGYYANNAPQISYSEFTQRALSEDEEYGSIIVLHQYLADDYTAPGLEALAPFRYRSGDIPGPRIWIFDLEKQAIFKWLNLADVWIFSVIGSMLRRAS